MITRRDFIKFSAASAVALAVGVNLNKSAIAKEADVDKWVKGTCRFCGTGCSVYIGVKTVEL